MKTYNEQLGQLLTGWDGYDPTRPSITKEMCIAELKRVAKQLGRTPTQAEFNKCASIGCLSVSRRFGTWNKALKVVGLVPNVKYGMTKSQALAELLRIAKQLGHSPTYKEFNKHGAMSGSLIQRLLGSWNEALKTAGLVVNSVRDTTKPQVLSELKSVAKKLGHTPTIEEFNVHSTMTVAPAALLFGSWNKALKAAGLAPNSLRGITKANVLTELKRVAKKLGHTPTKQELNNNSAMCNAHAVETTFGSWSAGLKAAGLSVNFIRGVDKTLVLTELKRVANKIRHTPTGEEFDNNSMMSRQPVRRLFGSWAKGLKAAGLVIKEIIDKTQVLTELKRVAKKLGHTPTLREFNEHANMSPTTVIKQFGSWNNALKMACLTHLT